MRTQAKQLQEEQPPNGGPSLLARRGVIEAFLLLACLLAYSWSLTGPWLMDDTMSRDAAKDIGQVWTHNSWFSKTARIGVYRPLTLSFFVAQRNLSYDWTFPYHLVNVILHGLVTLLVWRAGTGASRTAAAFFVGLLFAWHPIHVEAVASISGRSEIMVALFFLCALVAHRKIGETPPSPLPDKRKSKTLSPQTPIPWKMALVVGLGQAAAMFSKETGVVLLLYYVVEDLARGRLSTAAQRVRLAPSYCALAFAALLYAFLRLQAGEAITADGAGSFTFGPHHSGLREYLALSATAALKNAQLIFLPLDQQAVWSIPDLSHFGFLPIISGLGLLALLFASIPVAVRTGSSSWLAVSFICISSLLLMQIIRNDIWVWERGLYVPSIGLCWLIYAWIIGFKDCRVLKLALWTLGVILPVTLIRTFQLNGLYTDDVKFWRHQLARHPTDSHSMSSLAVAIKRQGDLESAMKLIEQAYQITPRRAAIMPSLVSWNVQLSRMKQAEDLLTTAAKYGLDFRTLAQRAGILKELSWQADKLGLHDVARQFSEQAKRTE